MKHPAETAGITGAIAFLTARLIGVKDADTVTAIGTVVGFVPAAVTWIVIKFQKVPSK